MSIGDLARRDNAGSLVRNLEDSVLKTALSEKYGDVWSRFLDQEYSMKADSTMKVNIVRKRKRSAVARDTVKGSKKRRASSTAVSSRAIVVVADPPRPRTRAERAAARAVARG